MNGFLSPVFNVVVRRFTFCKDEYISIIVSTMVVENLRSFDSIQ